MHEADHAIIKPFKLDEVRQQLPTSVIQGVTVTEVHGVTAASRGIRRFIGARTIRSISLPKAKVELAVDDSIAEQVMESCLQRGANGECRRWKSMDSRSGTSTAGAYR